MKNSEIVIISIIVVIAIIAILLTIQSDKRKEQAAQSVENKGAGSFFGNLIRGLVGGS